MNWGTKFINVTEGKPNVALYENKHFIFFGDHASLAACNSECREKRSIIFNADCLFLKGPSESTLIV